jgi:hypothetical protein
MTNATHPANEPLNRDEWLTVREAAGVTAYHPEHVRQLTREGTVISRKVSSTILVSRDSLLSYKSSMDELGSKRYSKRLARKRRVKTQAVTEISLQGSGIEQNMTAAASQSDDSDMQRRYRAVIALLDQLSSATGIEATEQRETGRYLIQSLDEDRPSNRKLFPHKRRSK